MQSMDNSTTYPIRVDYLRRTLSWLITFGTDLPAEELERDPDGDETVPAFTDVELAIHRWTRANDVTAPLDVRYYNHEGAEFTADYLAWQQAEADSEAMDRKADQVAQDAHAAKLVLLDRLTALKVQQAALATLFQITPSRVSDYLRRRDDRSRKYAVGTVERATDRARNARLRWRRENIPAYWSHQE